VARAPPPAKRRDLQSAHVARTLLSAKRRERVKTLGRKRSSDEPIRLCVITLASLYYIFFFPGEVYSGEEKTRLGYLRERKEAVYENLRDLNFEYKAGKVPDRGLSIHARLARRRSRRDHGGDRATGAGCGQLA